MHIATPTLQQDSVQRATMLHIMSNFAVGATVLNDYWREQITSLRQKALPFQGYRANSLTFTGKVSALVQNVFEAPDTTLDIWPSLCSFLASDGSASESFLLLSIIKTESVSGVRTSQKYELVFRFAYPEHLELVEHIERARKLVLCTSSKVEYTVSFYELELANQLEHIRPMFR